MAPKKPQGRDVMVSKALSYILRHAAEKEGLEMNAQGYANVADVLAWRKLKSLKVTLPEIMHAVADSDKKRFALLHIPSEAEQPTATATATTETPEPSSLPTPETSSAQETATQKALTATHDTDPTHFLIRATQGHSIKSIDAASLLEKLTLDDPSKLPSTVVHGTFHSAWPAILKSGGLKCMSRNHVHFATGPTLQAVLGESREDGVKKALGEAEDGKVISGMRRSAQVLIYVNLKRALEGGCPFWRSENGVILSEGVGGLVPLEFVDVVVERKIGLGRIWEGGKVLKDLP